MLCKWHLPQKGHQGHLQKLQGSGFAFGSFVQAEGGPDCLQSGWAPFARSAGGGSNGEQE